MAQQFLSGSSVVPSNLELAAREAELNRRESALERRERELEQLMHAVEGQRARLDDVREEYESRRETLKERTLEVEAERDRLRTEQARLIAVGIEEELTEDTPPPKKVEAGADWWSQQLGKPLEAA